MIFKYFCSLWNKNFSCLNSLKREWISRHLQAVFQDDVGHRWHQSLIFCLTMCNLVITSRQPFSALGEGEKIKKPWIQCMSSIFPKKRCSQTQITFTNNYHWDKSMSTWLQVRSWIKKVPLFFGVPFSTKQSLICHDELLRIHSLNLLRQIHLV
jgi:hypothetical protein